MNQAFYNGITGVKTHQFGMDIVADNIANINRTGFKATVAEFSTIYDQTLGSLGGGPVSNEVGIGSRPGASRLDFTPGTTIQTDNPFDMSINGEGWFGTLDENQEMIFTRAGLFGKDAQGYLVDNLGYYLLGTNANNIEGDKIKKNYQENITLAAPKEQDKIQLPDSLRIDATPTKEVTLKGTLNPTPIYELQPDGTQKEIPNHEEFRTYLINPDGTENLLKINFEKVLPQQGEGSVWSAKANIFDTQNNPISEAKGEVRFDNKGALIESTLSSIDNNGIPISLNFGTPISNQDPNSGYDGLSSFYGVDTTTKQITADGEKAGELLAYGVEEDGTIYAQFNNGKNIPIAQIALYHFQNDAGLQQTSPVYFRPTPNSGEPIFYKDKEGNILHTSTIKTFSLESSNVDLSTALTELIVMQKAYDANAKSITTGDELIQNAINMKK